MLFATLFTTLASSMRPENLHKVNTALVSQRCNVDEFDDLGVDATFGDAKFLFASWCRALLPSSHCSEAGEEIWKGQDLVAQFSVNDDSEFCLKVHEALAATSSALVQIGSNMDQTFLWKSKKKPKEEAQEPCSQKEGAAVKSAAESPLMSARERRAVRREETLNRGTTRKRFHLAPLGKKTCDHGRSAVGWICELAAREAIEDDADDIPGDEPFTRRKESAWPKGCSVQASGSGIGQIHFTLYKKAENKGDHRLVCTGPAKDSEDFERVVLRRGRRYSKQKGLDSVSKDYLLGNASVWTEVEMQQIAVGTAMGLKKHPQKEEEDDESHGPSIGLVAATLSLDPAQIDKLPSAFQMGVFEKCSVDACPTMPAAVRVSATALGGAVSTRIALKLNTTTHGEVDFHFAETTPVFPMGNKAQFQAYLLYKMGRLDPNNPKKEDLPALKALGAVMAQMKAAGAKYMLPAFNQSGSLGKTYFSHIPYRIGAAGPKAGAFKIRLSPQQPQSAPSGTKEHLVDNFRDQFVADVQAKVHKFNFEIQVATSASDHPINDVAQVWSETSSPWIRMGTIEIPQQSFASPADNVNVVGSGLWVNGNAIFNSKELAFLPGTEASPHSALGDIGKLRSYIYPVYDVARQKHLLKKADGAPATCPWSKMR